MLDSTRLKAELTHIHRALATVAAGARGKNLVDDLRRTIGGTTDALVRHALFADCLRVVHAAAAADGTIGEDEIEALYELLFSVARHYAAVLPGSYGDFEAIDHDSARTFLEHYAADRGAFGRGAAVRWPGLVLCRRAAELGESEPIERYEQTMGWLISAACQTGGVTESDPRWQGRVGELDELRGSLVRDARVTSQPADSRVEAFLAPTRVFSAVAHASSVYEADPFDVETIHADARATFEQMVERATTPAQHRDRGRMLLLLGDSGAGKTHLLRGFRQHVHEYGRGFVAYAQLHSSSEEYARYLLGHVVDSLARPYAGPSGERTGLHELALGLPRLIGAPLTTEVDRLANESWETPETLADYVNRIVDGLLCHAELARFDPDLLRVMLFALHPDHSTTSRVYKYLRCENMTAADRRRIGDVIPRTDKGDPDKMIRELARLAFVTQHAALVLMIDQAELAGFDKSSSVAFQRAVDTLHGIVGDVPSAIAVIACLSDLYSVVRPQLTKFAIDRLEMDPSVERLQINRSYDEIRQLVGRRLSWLFADAGAAYRPEQPVYPFPEERLKGLTNFRTRDVLEWCHQYQSQCALAGKLLEEVEPVAPEPPKPPGSELDLDQIALAWNDAIHAPGIELPDDDDEIVAVVGAAAKACCDEIGIALTTPPRKNGAIRIQLASDAQRTDLALAVTNKSYHRGSFVTQIEALRKSAGPATPVAVRTLEFPTGPACDKAMAQLLKAGGRRAYLDPATLRTLVAAQRFQPSFPPARIDAWRRRDRPISSLSSIAHIFELDRFIVATPPPAPVEPPVVVAPTASSPTTAPVAAAPMAATPVTTPPIPVPPAVRPPPLAPVAATKPSSRLRVGTASGFKTEERCIELESLVRHTGVLGSNGSGKTTLALNLIEQALERDVAVVLVDRKGDLAGYAKPGWWQQTSDPERARKLADSVDVRFFTPGTRGGRPLSLSVVPDLDQVPDHEGDRLIQYAAQALAAMMRLGHTGNAPAQRAILTQAIAVLARRRGNPGLPELVALLENRDDELISRAGRYDDKLFKRLVQDVETVRLSDADLFDPAAEALTAETLIGRAPGGKVPLAIASTRFLGDVDRVQSWVAHLIACLSRHVAKSPSTTLRTLFMIDEADLFMPAGASKPPSKEPLQDLLKRARAGGLGVMLASQSPADFDYRSREQITTWFLGRIADKRSIEKMRPLFENRPAVGAKLGGLEAGRFVMVQEGGTSDLERTPSLLRTEQLGEAELMALAAQTRAARA